MNTRQLTKNALTSMLAASVFTAVPSIVFAADGTLGESSTGRIYISLDIGASELAILSTAVATTLQQSNSTSFPICFSYIDSQFVNVSVSELQQDGFSLIAADGSEIPYQISLGSSSSSIESASEAKVKAISTSSCLEGSALEVNVTLQPTTGQGELESINGKFNFLVKSE